MTPTRHPDKSVTVRSGIVGMLHDVSAIAGQCRSLNQALQSTVERLVREFEWPLGNFFVPGTTGVMEFAGGIRRLETPGGEELILASRSARYGPGRGWAARVLEERAPVWIRDLREAEEELAGPRRQLALDHGLRGLVAAPVVLGEEVLAVMEFFTAAPFQPGAELLDAMSLVSSHLGRVVAQARTAAELRRARDRPVLGEDFFLTVSHKVRTPMNAVVGLTELLLHTPLTPEQKDYVETVRTSGADLMKTVDSVLKYLQLELTEGEGVEEVFGLRSCLEEAIGAVAQKAPVKELVLGYRLADSVPDALVGDAPRLRQILVHLLENAIDFTPRGEVDLTVEKAGASSRSVEPRLQGRELTVLEFSVRDTGVGISVDRLEELFQPFSGIDTADPRGRGGIGLGLAISRKLCRQLGGELRVESELGRGCIFRFAISLGVADRKAATDHRADTEVKVPTLQEGAREVLVVEDDRLNQTIAVKMLEALDLNSEVASNGRRALEALGRRPYDAVLMDVEMPEMDGFETTRRIRRGWPVDQQPYIIAMTAKAMPGDREKCIAAGMNGYVSKPVTIEALRRALELGEPPEDRQAQPALREARSA